PGGSASTRARRALHKLEWASGAGSSPVLTRSRRNPFRLPRPLLCCHAVEALGRQYNCGICLRLSPNPTGCCGVGPASARELSLSARCLTGHHFVSTVSTRPFWLRKHVDRQDGSGSTGAANMNAAKPCPCRHRGIATGLVVTSPVGSPTIERRGRGQWTRSV